MSKTIVEVEMLPNGYWEVTQVDLDEKFGYRFDERVLGQFPTREEAVSYAEEIGYPVSIIEN